MGTIKNFIKLKKLNKIIETKVSDIKIPNECEMQENEYLFVKKG